MNQYLSLRIRQTYTRNNYPFTNNMYYASLENVFDEKVYKFFDNPEDVYLPLKHKSNSVRSQVEQTFVLFIFSLVGIEMRINL